MILDLGPNSDRLPRNSNDIGDGYIFLRARDASACLIDGNPGTAIRKFYEERGYGDFEDDWFPHIV
jgi:hypothetical protein